MKKIVNICLVVLCLINSAQAQTAVQFTGLDCNNYPVDLFADLDAGKAVVLEFYMPNCGSCPPPAQRIQAMGNKINQTYPGMVKGYAFPYQNSTTCAYSASWVNSNNLSSFWTPMDSGAYQVAYYGGFGMPTIVLLGGQDHRVMFSTLSFSTSDTTIMRDSILALFGSTGINDLPENVNSFSLYPNPSIDNVSISLEVTKSEMVKIEMIDNSGKIVNVIWDGTINGNWKHNYDISSLAAGNYFIRLSINDKITTRRLNKL